MKMKKKMKMRMKRERKKKKKKKKKKMKMERKREREMWRTRGKVPPASSPGRSSPAAKPRLAPGARVEDGD